MNSKQFPHYFTIFFSRILFMLFWFYLPAQAEDAVLQPSILAEEEVYEFEPMNNGSGPMWCRGNTCIVRVGDLAAASGMETIKGASPLNNCLPLLFAREENDWEQVFRGTGRTREPGPLTVFEDGRIFYSTNPTLTEPNVYNGPAKPTVLEFDLKRLRENPNVHYPQWEGDPEFTEHSYRTFVADGERQELFLLQNSGDAHAEWSFRDSKGNWSAQGKLKWPYEEDYDKPQPVRLCYPAVALKDRQVFFLGVSDIIEPYDEWREYKYELTGRKWDYDFRRLFYTWSDDITSGEFNDWVEIASRDKTAGWITPWDVYAHPNGTVFVLWTERAIDERLREKFFPQAKQRYSLELAIIRKGKVIQRITILEGGEGLGDIRLGGARLHVSEDQRLFVIYYMSGTKKGESIASNFIAEIDREGNVGEAKKVKFDVPFTSFFTNTVRAGNQPSNFIDLFGQRGNTMRYGSVKLY